MDSDIESLSMDDSIVDSSFGGEFTANDDDMSQVTGHRQEVWPLTSGN